MTWCVWMKMPATDGFSRVAGGLTQQEAEWLAGKLFFTARAMPDREGEQ